MKKLFLTLIVAFATLCGFAQGNSVVTDYHYRSGTVHFNGRFTNGTSQDFPKQILLIFENEFTNTEVNSLVKVDADGTFASDVYVPHSTTVYLRADSYTGPLPNDLYFFVGDTVTLSVDVATRNTSITPSSICYWVDRCRPISQEPYAKSPYGDLCLYSSIHKQGRKAVEDYCRNTGKVMENLISQNSKQVMNCVGNSQERVRPENWVEVVTEHEYDYTSGNPAVYVGTYYKYNCGSLFGMWVDLTSFLDYDDFMEFCHLLHIDEEDPEFMYQDHENFSSEWYSESCFDEVTFDKILEYGNMDEEDRNMFDAFTDNYGEGYTIEDVRERFKGKWDSEEQFAEQLLDDCYDLPEFARRYFDIEQFARDLFAYDYTFCDGYVFSDY